MNTAAHTLALSLSVASSTKFLDLVGVMRKGVLSVESGAPPLTEVIVIDMPEFLPKSKGSVTPKRLTLLKELGCI